jgi:cell fate (sporulation/competence/biofilm development) regulator YmcA (YheA/YmcA/DUF963 family)
MEKNMNNYLSDIEDLKNDILNTNEYKDYKKYDELLSNNSEIKSLIKEITILQKESERLGNKDINIDIKLEDLYDKLHSYDDYNKYIESSKKLNELISNIQNNFEEYFNSLIKKNSD